MTDWGAARRWAAALLIALTAAACTGERPATDPQASPSPDAVTQPSPAPTATEGTATGPIADPTGDVTDPDGQPPPDTVAAADLVAVELDVTEAELSVRFRLAGPPPPHVDSLLWSVRTERDGEPVLTISAQQVGPEVFGAVYDWRTGEQQQRPVEVDRNHVVVRVPRGAVSDLGETWTALVQLDGAYEDDTPPAQLPGVGGGR